MSRVISEDSKLTITPLGAGSEVGRSAFVVKYKNKSVMFDCGIHPAHSGISSLPYFDEIDPSKIDLLLISHFHLDHIAALPYFLEKTYFQGKCLMTAPTKSIYYLILQDYVRVSNIAADEMLYDIKDLENSLAKIQLIDYHQSIMVNGIRVTAYNAGHVLGDFSRREDRHLNPADIPEVSPDILITESTYGVQTLNPPNERENRFVKFVTSIVKGGGRCLIPVFALGRAQELLLILEEAWNADEQLKGKVPIHYASSLAKKCMPIYISYPNMMNNNIQKKIAEGQNPFDFTNNGNIDFMTDTSKFFDTEPCVVIASPGMLQNGISREFFDMWASDSQNGVIIPGYCVEGTLAKTLMSDFPYNLLTVSEPRQFTATDGTIRDLKCKVSYVSFSAHADYTETINFIDELKPPYIILIHGDINEMSRLKFAIEDKYSDGSVKVSTPKNCQTVQLEFHTDRIAKLMGQLATTPPQDGSIISGLVIKKDFNQMIVSPNELSQFSSLSSSQITQSLVVPFYASFTTFCSFLSSLFQIELSKKASSLSDEDIHSITVYDTIDITHYYNKDHVLITWEANPLNDMIVDSVVTLLMTVQNHLASVPVLSPNLVEDPRIKAHLEAEQPKRREQLQDIENKLLLELSDLTNREQISEKILNETKLLLDDIFCSEDSQINIVPPSQITINDVKLQSDEKFSFTLNFEFVGSIPSYTIDCIDDETKKRIQRVLDRLLSIRYPLVNR